MTDEEFAELMQEKEQSAKQLLSSQEKLSDEDRLTWIKRMNLESDLISAIGSRLVYNEQKKQSFIFRHNLRKAYKDGINIRAQFVKSEKFRPENQKRIDDFDIVMKKALTVSYEQLLKDYLDHPSIEYEQEYPEFKDIRLYLKETEMNSLRWNKEKMIKAVSDKKKLPQAFRAIYVRDAFISNEELKLKLAEQFNRLGITLTAKATLIKECDIYKVERCSQYIDGKKTNGYRFKDMILKFDF